MMIVNGIIIEQASSFSPRLRFTCKLLQKSAYPIMYWHHSRRTHQTILPTMTQGQPFSEQRQSQVSIIITLSLRCTPRFATILIGSSSLAPLLSLSFPQSKITMLISAFQTPFKTAGQFKERRNYIWTKRTLYHFHLTLTARWRGVGVGKKREGLKRDFWRCCWTGIILHNVIMTSCCSAYFASPLITSSVTWPSFLCLFIGSSHLSLYSSPFPESNWRPGSVRAAQL